MSNITKTKTSTQVLSTCTEYFGIMAVKSLVLDVMELKKDSSHNRETPVIVISGYIDEQNYDVDSGAVFLEKPVRQDRLERCLKIMLLGNKS